MKDGFPLPLIEDHLDRGDAFRSDQFKEYCEEQKIKLINITTEVSRGNGQVERTHRTLIPVLTKLSLNNDNEWNKHVSKLQQRF